MKLNHEVISAEWIEEKALWSVKVKNLQDNTVFVDQAQILINGGGVLK
jgi:cation diffusion facilitator CzcD-associated flavoprotein CzcO